MADFKQIDEARKILGVEEEANIEENKEAFISLVFLNVFRTVGAEI